MVRGNEVWILVKRRSAETSLKDPDRIQNQARPCNEIVLIHTKRISDEHFFYPFDNKRLRLIANVGVGFELLPLVQPLLLLRRANTGPEN